VKIGQELKMVGSTSRDVISAQVSLVVILDTVNDFLVKQ
jgi:hypothetical protein